MFQSSTYVNQAGLKKGRSGKMKHPTLFSATALIACALSLTACSAVTASVKQTPAANSSSASQSQTAQPTQPDTPAPSTPASFNLAIGTDITLTDDDSGASWDVTVNSVKGYRSTNEFEDKPPAGQHYILIDVTYSVTSGSADVNEFDWTAKDSTGLVSDPQVVDSPNALSATTVQAGSKIRGTVVLLITNHSDGTIVYSAGSEENASWQFTASQAAIR